MASDFVGARRALLSDVKLAEFKRNLRNLRHLSVRRAIAREAVARRRKERLEERRV